MSIAEVLADHPDRSTFDADELRAAIEACWQCAAICNLCADSDLRRDASAMRDCIKSCVDCATVCTATAAILSRPSPGGHAWEALVAACADFCAQCAAECEHHDDVCCRECAAACRTCEQVCRRLLTVAD